MRVKGDRRGSTPVLGLEYIVAIVIVAAVLSGLISIVTIYLGIKLDTHGLENTILIKRVTYEPGLLVYTDSRTRRSYPGTIDMSLFSTQKLEENFILTDSKMAAVLELKDLKTGNITTAYINEKRARVWDDIAPIGDFDPSYTKRYVRIYQDGEIHPGLLKIKAIYRR